MDTINRIEVWFKDGLFRAFPDVTKIEESDDSYMVAFGQSGTHTARIFKDAINFMEFMESEN